MSQDTYWVIDKGVWQRKWVITESANDDCVIEGDSAETKEVEGKYQRKEVKFGPNVQSCNNHLMIFFSLFFGFRSMHFLFKLKFIFSFLFQFSTLFSGLPYDMVFFFFFSFFHFFTCLLRFGHTFYLSKKSMLQKKIWIWVVPNRFK